MTASKGEVEAATKLKLEERMQLVPKVGDYYLHTKTNTLYFVVSIATLCGGASSISLSDQRCVVYQKKDDHTKTWVRTVTDWNAVVPVGAERRHRFIWHSTGPGNR